VVEEFVCLGSLIHSTTHSSTDSSCCNAITHAATQNLDNPIWKSRIFIYTKLKSYNTCTVHIFVYGSECCAVTKTDVLKIDAAIVFIKVLGIKWYHPV